MSREIVKAFSGILGRAIAIDPLQMIARLLSGLSAHDKAQRWTAAVLFDSAVKMDRNRSALARRAFYFEISTMQFGR